MNNPPLHEALFLLMNFYIVSHVVMIPSLYYICVCVCVCVCVCACMYVCVCH